MGITLELLIGLSAGTFVAGVLFGWIIGDRLGRKRAKPDLNWQEFVRENAGYDFNAVRGKADQIVTLASEIVGDAKRGQKMVTTLTDEQASGKTDNDVGARWSTSGDSFKIYSGTGTYGGRQVGYVDGEKIYRGTGTYGGNQAGYFDGQKIYRGTGTYGGSQAGYVDGEKIYRGTGTYGGNQVGYCDGQKVYRGTGTYGGAQVGYTDIGGGLAFAAAALLLLL